MEINKFTVIREVLLDLAISLVLTTFRQQIQFSSPDHFLLRGACSVGTRLCSTAVSCMCSSDFLINACYTWFLFLKIAPTSLKHVQCQEVPSIPKKLRQHIWCRPTAKSPQTGCRGTGGNIT